jgi:hypothetical protein
MTTAQTRAEASPEARPETRPQAQPETLVREYRRAREHARDAARLQRAGWEVVSILERPAPAGWLARATGGRAAWSTPDVERLVTYVWRGRGECVPRGGSAGSGVAWPAVRRAVRRQQWWWLALVAFLVLVLVIGLLSFFGDTLLPGLLAIAVSLS